MDNETKKFNCHSDDTTKHIQGIVCEVKNCVHHDCETYCTAGKIAVGPSYACTNAETVCATFEQKAD